MTAELTQAERAAKAVQEFKDGAATMSEAASSVTTWESARALLNDAIEAFETGSEDGDELALSAIGVIMSAMATRISTASPEQQEALKPHADKMRAEQRHMAYHQLLTFKELADAIDQLM